MQTECPNCHTLFRITEAQLDIADGMVRCGYCKKVFDARPDNQLHDNKDQLDTFEGDQLKGIHATKYTEENKPDHEAFVSSEASEILPGESGSESHFRPYSTAATTAWSLAILALMATLVAEYIWFNQPQLLQGQRFKPVTAILCKLTDCDHLQIRDPAQIQMISRNVYTHPNETDALMISTTLVNHASYAQPYPDVQIDFSNVRGELIASRRFLPNEYLQIAGKELSLMPSGNPVTFGLEIRDPGKEAITYEFSFH